MTLVDELARAGVEHACISPGSRSAPLALAFSDDARIRVHVVLDERSAAFTALGIAKASLRPAAVVCTSGTAAANLHPAVIEAHHARTPLIVMTADRPPELRDTGAPQTIDQARLFAGSARWFAEIGPPEIIAGAIQYWRSIAARACVEAVSSPPGPVHLNVALRDPLVSSPGEEGNREEAGIELPGRAGGAAWASAAGTIARASTEEVERLTEDMARVERGVLVAGAGTWEAEPLLALARAVAWPVLAEPASNLRAPGPSISTYDALLRHTGFARTHKPELVVRLGSAGISKALVSWLSPDVPQILVDRDGRWLDPARSAGRLLAADPSVLASDVLQRLQPRRSSRWLDSWLSCEGRARRAVDEVLDSHGEPSEPRAARDLAAALPDRASLVVAASMPVRDLDSFMLPRSGLRVLGNRGANGIDGFVSTTLGVALAGIGPVAALGGDLSMLHDQNGLLLTRRAEADAVFVVLNNDGGGIFSFLPQAAFTESFEELFATPQGVSLEALARMYGCGYERVDVATDLAPLTLTALDEGGVHLIEVRTHREANVKLHRELWEAASDTLDAME